MERFVKIILDTDYCGTKEEIYMKTDMNDRELDAYVSDEAYNNAMEYEDLADINDDKEERDYYYQGTCANSYWEEVTKEEYEENRNE